MLREFGIAAVLLIAGGMATLAYKHPKQFAAFFDTYCDKAWKWLQVLFCGFAFALSVNIVAIDLPSEVLGSIPSYEIKTVRWMAVVFLWIYGVSVVSAAYLGVLRFWLPTFLNDDEDGETESE